MQLIYMLLIVCVTMAALKVALMVLIAIFGIWLLAATIRHPREALGFTLMLATMSLIETHPWIALIGFVVMALIASLSV